MYELLWRSTQPARVRNWAPDTTQIGVTTPTTKQTNMTQNVSVGVGYVSVQGYLCLKTAKFNILPQSDAGIYFNIYEYNKDNI